jgi:hypothetical protein
VEGKIRKKILEGGRCWRGKEGSKRRGIGRGEKKKGKVG